MPYDITLNVLTSLVLSKVATLNKAIHSQTYFHVYVHFSLTTGQEIGNRKMRKKNLLTWSRVKVATFNLPLLPHYYCGYIRYIAHFEILEALYNPTL